MRPFRCQKKPVVVEAMLYTRETIPDVITWLIENHVQNEFACPTSDSPGCTAALDEHSLTIVTLEGKMLVSDGDYVIKGARGEFYQRKPDIFQETYEVL